MSWCGRALFLVSILYLPNALFGLEFVSQPGVVRVIPGPESTATFVWQYSDVTTSWLDETLATAHDHVAGERVIFFYAGYVLMRVENGYVQYTDPSYSFRIEYIHNDGTTNPTGFVLGNLTEVDTFYNYRCRLEYDDGQGINSDDAYLYFFGTPDTPSLNISTSQAVIEMDDVEMTCESASTSVPAQFRQDLCYLWYLNGTDITDSPSDRYVASNDTLTVTASRTDSDQFYTCAAAEPEGLMSDYSQPVMMDVLYRPDPAVILGAPTDFIVEGEPLQLACEIPGSYPSNPTPHRYHWRNMNTGYNDTTANRTLIIDYVTVSEHHGRFQCAAENTVGLGGYSPEVLVTVHGLQPTACLSCNCNGAECDLYNGACPGSCPAGCPEACNQTSAMPPQYPWEGENCYTGNVAYLKTEITSSVARDDRPNSMAVDGITANENCTQLRDDDVAWWELDLEALYFINEVYIHIVNADRYVDMNNFQVSVKNNLITTCNGSQGEDPVDKGGFWSMTCEVGTIGQYIQFYKTNAMDSKVDLCEVVVIGTLETKDFCAPITTTNLPSTMEPTTEPPTTVQPTECLSCNCNGAECDLYNGACPGACPAGCPEACNQTSAMPPQYPWEGEDCYTGNIAYLKTNIMSSTVRDERPNSMAVDGITANENCTQLRDDDVAWWELNLETSYFIQEVYIYVVNADRHVDMTSFQVLVKDDTLATTCNGSQGEDPVDRGGFWSMTCDVGTIGQYIQFYKPNAMDSKVDLCEVVIIGTLETKDFCPPINLNHRQLWNT